jgi:hypothetical protein
LFANWHPVIHFEQDAFARGDQLLKPRAPKYAVIDAANILPWSWSGINLSKESQGPEKATDSIQRRVIDTITLGAWDVAYSVVFDDDNSGEAADVIGIVATDEELKIDLFHCKFTKETPGERIKDLYEVCGQAQRSIKWRENPMRLLVHMDKREKAKQKSMKITRFERGSLKLLAEIRNKVRVLRPKFRVFIVQPGLSKARVTDDQKQLLGSTELYLNETFGIPLRIISSE